ADPFKGQTSIGDLGNLKLSDKIEFKIKADQPLLLMQTSYDIYSGQDWYASTKDFKTTNPVKNTDNSPLKQIDVIQAFDKEKILALPDGTVNILGLEGAYLQYTQLGAVKITQAPSLGQYRVFYTGKRRDASSRRDVTPPKQHQDWLVPFSEKLQLQGLAPQAIANKIVHHFRKNFYYSLYLGDETDADLALKDFILNRKAGHCEYFAVATVLLLRQAGIPARLANGYAVDEYDKEQDLYIVRRRHAHAWAIAYINGVWQAVDSTPSQWLDMEAENASWLQPLNDWFSERLLSFKQWQIQQVDKDKSVYWLVAVVLLLLYLAIRIYSARRQLSHKNLTAEENCYQRNYKGLDSEFYLIEQYFSDSPKARNENESIQQWIKRINLAELQELYQLHYQLRFDPAGISKAKREYLRQAVNTWLQEIERIEPVRHEN
ncbi:MAG: hypothetical protein GQ569_12075, partial [Methylococcaceae bacterium]|nr:hypothetical protein [Methylococcaceae bacterium]